MRCLFGAGKRRNYKNNTRLHELLVVKKFQFFVIESAGLIRSYIRPVQSLCPDTNLSSIGPVLSSSSIVINDQSLDCNASLFNTFGMMPLDMLV